MPQQTKVEQITATLVGQRWEADKRTSGGISLLVKLRDAQQADTFGDYAHMLAAQQAVPDGGWDRAKANAFFELLLPINSRPLDVDVGKIDLPSDDYTHQMRPAAKEKTERGRVKKGSVKWDEPAGSAIRDFMKKGSSFVKLRGEMQKVKGVSPDLSLRLAAAVVEHQTGGFGQDTSAASIIGDFEDKGEHFAAGTEAWRARLRKLVEPTEKEAIFVTLKFGALALITSMRLNQHDESILNVKKLAAPPAETEILCIYPQAAGCDYVEVHQRVIQFVKGEVGPAFDYLYVDEELENQDPSLKVGQTYVKFACCSLSGVVKSMMRVDASMAGVQCSSVAVFPGVDMLWQDRLA